MSSLKDRRSRRTEAARATSPQGPPRVVVGRLAGVTADGTPLVEFLGNPAAGAVRAAATARYNAAPKGASVALMFLDNDPARPLAIGVIAEPRETGTQSVEERLTLGASREIVLQCGRASIVLTRAGKVLVRGAYVSLRSSGMQRITGASVQIN
jgi:hypothetical protein